MKKIKNEKYEGFSLVEMLITIVIIGIVMLISSVTLTTLVKVSSVSSNKTRVRNESEFILELIRRTVRNSNPSDVYIYNSRSARTFNTGTRLIEDNGTSDLSAVYSESLSENEVGNEIHFRPYGYDNWICIGFFESSTSEIGQGYIVKTTTNDLQDGHEECFNSENNNSGVYTIVLNSDSVSINNFNIAYTKTTDENYLIRFDIDAEPVYWYFGKGAPVTKKVLRQTVVKTEGLIW